MWGSAGRPSRLSPAAQPAALPSPSPPQVLLTPSLAQLWQLGRSAWSAQQTGLFELIRVQPLEASSLVPGNVRGAVLPFGKSYECWGFKGGTSESSWHWPRSVPFEVQELPAGCAGSKAQQAGCSHAASPAPAQSRKALSLPGPARAPRAAQQPLLSLLGLPLILLSCSALLSGLQSGVSAQRWGDRAQRASIHPDSVTINAHRVPASSSHFLMECFSVSQSLIINSL